MAFTSLSINRMQSIIDGKLDRIIAAVCKITDYKKMFLLHPLIATDAEIERETGLKRAEIARISREMEQRGQIYQGRTINGKYCRLRQEIKSQDSIMKQFIEEVKAHLEKVAQKDEAFAAKFNAKCEAEQGSIEKCCGYIVSEVQRKYKTGNRIESIEVSLTAFKVMQSRGKYNKDTDQHDKILRIMRRNMNQIKTIRQQAV